MLFFYVQKKKLKITASAVWVVKCIYTAVFIQLYSFCWDELIIFAGKVFAQGSCFPVKSI